jgi:hypothetical protein
MNESIKGGTCERESCQWCLTSLTKENSLQKLVCQDCFRRLIRAGLTDAEIFKSDDCGKNSNKKP